MRIEQVEPCPHEITRSHRLVGEMLWCDGETRRVLDGFPPEAYEAAALAMVDGGNVDDLWRDWAKAALDAAWRVLTGDADANH